MSWRVGQLCGICTHTFTSFLPCRVTSCPGLSWAEEFPRMQDFQAKTGTVWGKPPPEACWYFKQQDLKTEWRQKWMQPWATLPLSAVSLTKPGAGTELLGAGFQDSIWNTCPGWSAVRPPFRECSFLPSLSTLTGELVGSEGYAKTGEILIKKKINEQLWSRCLCSIITIKRCFQFGRRKHQTQAIRIV